jgi:hypothetical protein
MADAFLPPPEKDPPRPKYSKSGENTKAKGMRGEAGTAPEQTPLPTAAGGLRQSGAPPPPPKSGPPPPEA